LIFANGFSITVSDLALAVQNPASASGYVPVFSLDKIEREMIFKALAQASGHHQKAAKLLGISRRTLSRKLKVYGTSEALQDSVA